LKVPTQQKQKKEMSKFLYFDEIDSTNDEAKRLIRSNHHDGMDEGLTLISTIQTKGRGQFDRTWFSDDEGGLYYTFVKKNPSIKDLSTKSIIKETSNIIKTCLETVTTCNIDLEWPNDLLLNDKKVGGILVEAVSSESQAFKFIIIGVGLNLNQESFPDAIKHVAISLKQYTGTVYNKTVLAETITKELTKCL
jgi:BirA family transcriptional regulator, biotin operon repressor / biotin---[acetyl-CoA-carboxylase] ligase